MSCQCEMSLVGWELASLTLRWWSEGACKCISPCFGLGALHSHDLIFISVLCAVSFEKRNVPVLTGTFLRPPALTSLCSTCMCPNDEQQISFKSSPVLRMTILVSLSRLYLSLRHGNANPKSSPNSRHPERVEVLQGSDAHRWSGDLLAEMRGG